MAAMLKVYVDRLSQPSRALIIFCRVNKIDFEEVTVNLAKREHRTSEFKKINPMGQVPAIVDGRFRLFESHAILRYLATVFPGVPDHWYPADLFTRAKIESILDWHHSNLRRGADIEAQGTVQASDFTTLQLQDSENPKDTPMYASESQEEVFYEEPNLYGAVEVEDYDIVYGGEFQESE